MNLTVNGTTHGVESGPLATLLDVLREELGVTSPKAGCEQGGCGACTVLVDGTPMKSCTMFAVQADGYEITTIEGLAPAPGELSIVQDAFCETHGLQCGYCTPGFIMASAGLLRKNPDPSDAEILEALGSNICRCTGYQHIVNAIQHAAGQR